jgi:hypothetical protein
MLKNNMLFNLFIKDCMFITSTTINFEGCSKSSEGSSHSWSCCKHDRQWQAETCDYLHNFAHKMLWKVVPNEACVVVCKPNGMDDIICIWELDDEPQCTFQIWKVEVIFNPRITLLLVFLSMLVGVNHPSLKIVVTSRAKKLKSGKRKSRKISRRGWNFPI